MQNTEELFQVGLAKCRLEGVSKISLVILILLSMQLVHASGAEGVDPNMAFQRDGAGVSGCQNGECDDLNGLATTQRDAKTIKKMIENRGGLYQLPKDAIELTPEEQKALKQKERDAKLNADGDIQKEKTESKLKDSMGTVSVGGKARIKPTRHGIKVKYEDSF